MKLHLIPQLSLTAILISCSPAHQSPTNNKIIDLPAGTSYRLEDEVVLPDKTPVDGVSIPGLGDHVLNLFPGQGCYWDWAQVTFGRGPNYNTQEQRVLFNGVGFPLGEVKFYDTSLEKLSRSTNIQTSPLYTAKLKEEGDTMWFSPYGEYRPSSVKTSSGNN